MKSTPFSAAVFAWALLTSGLLTGQILWGDQPLVSLEVDDVTEAGDAPVELSLWYNNLFGIDQGSGDDADLWVTSVSGFHSGVTFQEWLPLRRVGATGLYELAAPEGGWTKDHNGEYAVMLAGGEILTPQGEALPLMLAGSFHVRIGEVDQEVISTTFGTVSLESFPTPGASGGNVPELVVAELSATFPTPVDVSWGRVKQDADGNFSINVEARAFDGPVAQVVTDYAQQVEIGMLDPGTYTVVLTSEGEIIARDSITIQGGSLLLEGTPDQITIEINELPVAAAFTIYSAKITATYNEYVQESEWGQVRQNGSDLTSDLSVYLNPDVDAIAPSVVEFEVSLGILQPGYYTYTLTSFGNSLSEIAFEVPDWTGDQIDLVPPSVTVSDAIVNESSNEPLTIKVEFSDPSELSIAGIEAQLLTAMNRSGEEFEIERIGLDLTADFAAGAIAIYQIQPPGGSWDVGDRGKFRLLLSEPELVCDLKGNCLTERKIGYLTVDLWPEDPEPVNITELTLVHDELIGRWTAKARLFIPEDLAVRDDWFVNWGKTSPVGISFFLTPEFNKSGSGEPIEMIPASDTTGAGSWVEHDYDLGPVPLGFGLVNLESNLGHFGNDFLTGESSTLVDPVDSVEPVEPFDLWKERLSFSIGETGEAHFWEYCVGTDPENPHDDHLGDPKPEIFIDDAGNRHLALRCRMAASAIDVRMKFFASVDMVVWTELGPDQIQEVERTDRAGGIEEFLVCLTEGLEDGNFRYIKAAAERW